MRRILANGFAATPAMQPGQVRPQNLHVIADLRHRANGRAGRADGVALFDGDGGWDAFDPVHLRFVHPIEELAGIRRERFDVTPLALGVKGIEREGTFSRTAQACDDDEPMQRQIEIEILQVVMPHPAQTDDGR